MKKIIIPIILLLFVVIIVLLLNNKKEDVNNNIILSNNVINTSGKTMLYIRESSWSGWSIDYEPEERENLYDIELDKEYSIDDGNLVFTIKSISDDEIKIKTTEPFSDSKEGINLNTNKTFFEVKTNEELELTTPTMDAGYIYYLKLVK